MWGEVASGEVERMQSSRELPPLPRTLLNATSWG